MRKQGLVFELFINSVLQKIRWVVNLFSHIVNSIKLSYRQQSVQQIVLDLNFFFFEGGGAEYQRFEILKHLIENIELNKSKLSVKA